MMGINKKLLFLKKSSLLVFKWWCLQESNQGHKDFQSFALPTELRHHGWLIRVQRYDFFSFLQVFFKKNSKKFFINFYFIVFQRFKIHVF